MSLLRLIAFDRIPLRPYRVLSSANLNVPALLRTYSTNSQAGQLTDGERNLYEKLTKHFKPSRLRVMDTSGKERARVAERKPINRNIFFLKKTQ
jgi:hypothetical protein